MRSSPLSHFLIVITVAMAFADGWIIANHYNDKKLSSNQEALAATQLPTGWSPRSSESKPPKTVDFIFQTPYGLWESPWDEFAEEAVLAMIQNAWEGKELTTRDQKAAALLDAWKIVQARYGKKESLSTAEAEQILADLAPDISVRTILNPSRASLIDELSQGNWIWAPINGQAFDNPRYGEPGPRHHTILITGMNSENETFITQDPGTSRGKDQEYSQEKILNVIEDLDGTQTVLSVDISL